MKRKIGPWLNGPPVTTVDDPQAETDVETATSTGAVLADPHDELDVTGVARTSARSGNTGAGLPLP